MRTGSFWNNVVWDGGNFSPQISTHICAIMVFFISFFSCFFNNQLSKKKYRFVIIMYIYVGIHQVLILVFDNNTKCSSAFKATPLYIWILIFWARAKQNSIYLKQNECRNIMDLKTTWYPLPNGMLPLSWLNDYQKGQ